MSVAKLHLDMATADYYADPCSEPSLTQSVVKTLIEQSPRHAWLMHPKLNPDIGPDESTKDQNLGTVAHKMMIGRGGDLTIIEAENFRTKAAQEAKAFAVASGRTPILRCDYYRSKRMADAACKQLEDRGLLENWASARGEAVITWNEDGIYCRTMIDKLSDDLLMVMDLKTTSSIAAPDFIPNRMVKDGWDIQAAMHKMALDAYDPENAGRRRHMFIFVENYEPFALTVSEMTESTLTMGTKKILYAMETWKECIRTGKWPMYPIRIERPSYPDYAERQWVARELEDE